MRWKKHTPVSLNIWAVYFIDVETFISSSQLAPYWAEERSVYANIIYTLATQNR